MPWFVVVPFCTDIVTCIPYKFVQYCVHVWWARMKRDMIESLRIVETAWTVSVRRRTRQAT